MRSGRSKSKDVQWHMRYPKLGTSFYAYGYGGGSKTNVRGYRGEERRAWSKTASHKDWHLEARAKFASKGYGRGRP
eukprot:10659266-Karenia_brevis.AAC.1